MKRVGNLIGQISEPDNLRLAFWKACKGKSSKEEVIAYRSNLDNNLLVMRSEILSGNVNVGNYHYFTIYDPKQRQICASPFHERVLHHAIMNVCHIYFERYQIFDSYACRKGKGTYAALERAASFHRKYNYFLKLDVRKYFDTINHLTLKESLKRIFKDKKLLIIFFKIIDSYETSEGKGLPIGNLTSQYFANHALGLIDHFTKEKLLVKGYVRYMDDMVLWDNDKEKLLNLCKEVECLIQLKLDQELKPICLNYTNKGLPFLGYLLYPGYIKLALRSRIRFSRKVSYYFLLLEKGIWNQQEFQLHCLPLLAFTGYAQSLTFRRNVFLKIYGQYPWVLTA